MKKESIWIPNSSLPLLPPGPASLINDILESLLCLCVGLHAIMDITCLLITTYTVSQKKIHLFCDLDINYVSPQKCFYQTLPQHSTRCLQKGTLLKISLSQLQLYSQTMSSIMTV